MQESNMANRIDKKRFIPIVVIILATLAVVAVRLSAVQAAVDSTYAWLAEKFDWLFVLSNICAFGFSLWIAFGPYAKVKLGGEDAKPAFSKFSWIAMMFTTSCSAGLIVFGFIETTIYSSTAVPFHAEPFSIQAYEYAAMYTHYHWGFNAWSLYVPATVAVGYMLYNRGHSQINMSTACLPVLKKHANGILGTLTDIFGSFGAIMAPVTSMGLGMPLLTLLMQRMFGISDEYVNVLQIVILFIWVAMFGTSIYLGLEKGIKRLSDANVYLAFLFMLFVGVLAGVFNVLRAEIATLGMYVQNFVRMITYTDPYGDGAFIRNWTVWYWAWLIVYMPLMGVFNARISKGRTLREIALGQMLWCSLGCWVAMATLGNYGIRVQIEGIADIAGVLQTSGQPAAIVAILETMPLKKLMMGIVALLCFVFMATTVNSSAFVAAETTFIHKDSDSQAPRWCRVFWAAMICLITFVLLKVGGFNAVQVLALLIGLPLAILMFVVVASAVKAIIEDHGGKKNG